MGFEYTIRFRYGTAEQLDMVLQAVAEFTGNKNDFEGYEFGAAAAVGSMPDAEARVMPDGLYFCVYGGDGARILSELITSLRTGFGDVEVRELD